MEVKNVKVITYSNDELLHALIFATKEAMPDLNKPIYADNIVITQTVDEGLKATITIELD